MLPVTVFILAALPAMILQTGLILGMPWGQIAMGGKFADVFSPKLRISAALQLLLIITTVLIVLTRSSIILEGLHNFSRGAIWFVAGLYFISAILNLITTSNKERLLGAPTTILMFLSSSYIAMN